MELRLTFTATPPVSSKCFIESVFSDSSASILVADVFVLFPLHSTVTMLFNARKKKKKRLQRSQNISDNGQVSSYKMRASFLTRHFPATFKVVNNNNKKN